MKIAMRNRKLPLKAGLAIAGLTYCQIFAHMEINPFLKKASWEASSTDLSSPDLWNYHIDKTYIYVC